MWVSAGLHFFLETLGKDPFPCLFQLLVAHGPSLSSKPVMAGGVFLTFHCSDHASVVTSLSLTLLLPSSSTFRGSSLPASSKPAA